MSTYLRLTIGTIGSGSTEEHDSAYWDAEFVRRVSKTSVSKTSRSKSRSKRQFVKVISLFWSAAMLRRFDWFGLLDVSVPQGNRESGEASPHSQKARTALLGQPLTPSRERGQRPSSRGRGCRWRRDSD